MLDESFENEIFTLTDEDGNENQFEYMGSIEHEGTRYVALVPLEENDEGEYVLLKAVTEDGEDMLVTIDDDEEFERIVDIFEDEFFSELDYDDDDDDDEFDDDDEDEDEDEE